MAVYLRDLYVDRRVPNLGVDQRGSVELIDTASVGVSPCAKSCHSSDRYRTSLIERLVA